MVERGKIDKEPQEVDKMTDRSRYTVSLDSELFEKVENFRFDNRYQTRSQATVELIRLGLEAVEQGKGKKKGEGKE